MTNHIHKELTMYVRSMGKAFRVTAMFSTDEEANAYLEKHPDEGVIATSKTGLVMIANLYDRGATIRDTDAA